MIIPYHQLEQDTLAALLDDIVSREGTDYGAVEMSASDKILQLMQQLKAQSAFIYFDANTDSCCIISAEDAESLIESP